MMRRPVCAVACRWVEQQRTNGPAVCRGGAEQKPAAPHGNQVDGQRVLRRIGEFGRPRSQPSRRDGPTSRLAVVIGDPSDEERVAAGELVGRGRCGGAPDAAGSED